MRNSKTYKTLVLGVAISCLLLGHAKSACYTEPADRDDYGACGCGPDARTSGTCTLSVYPPGGYTCDCGSAGCNSDPTAQPVVVPYVSFVGSCGSLGLCATSGGGQNHVAILKPNVSGCPGA